MHPEAWAPVPSKQPGSAAAARIRGRRDPRHLKCEGKVSAKTERDPLSVAAFVRLLARQDCELSCDRATHEATIDRVCAQSLSRTLRKDSADLPAATRISRFGAAATRLDRRVGAALSARCRSKSTQRGCECCARKAFLRPSGGAVMVCPTHVTRERLNQLWINLRAISRLGCAGNAAHDRAYERVRENWHQPPQNASEVQAVQIWDLLA